MYAIFEPGEGDLIAVFDPASRDWQTAQAGIAVTKGTLYQAQPGGGLQGLAVSAQGLALDREAQILYRVEAEGSVVSYPVQAIAGVIPQNATFGVNDQGYPVILDGEGRPLRVWDKATQDWRLNVITQIPETEAAISNVVRYEPDQRAADLRAIALALHAQWDRLGPRGMSKAVANGTYVDYWNGREILVGGGYKGTDPWTIVVSRFEAGGYVISLIIPYAEGLIHPTPDQTEPVVIHIQGNRNSLREPKDIEADNLSCLTQVCEYDGEPVVNLAATVRIAVTKPSVYTDFWYVIKVPPEQADKLLALMTNQPIEEKAAFIGFAETSLLPGQVDNSP
jgi:hypothetical protein